MPCPAVLAPFSASWPDVVGAIELRGQLVPVIDLGIALGLQTLPPRTTAPIIVILRHAGHVHGFLAEGIDGVRSLTREMLGPITHAGLAPPAGPAGGRDGTLAGHQPVRPITVAAFVSSGQNGVVLDPSAIAGMPGLPLAQDAVGQRGGATVPVDPTLVFSVGELRCALPATCVDATLPRQSLLPAPVDDPLWIAMMEYKGAEIPVVDTLALLGQGHMAMASPQSAAIVVRTAVFEAGKTGETDARGLVALAIGGVDNIVRLPQQAISPLPAAMQHAALTRGIALIEGENCLLLDPASLAGDQRLCLLGKVEQKAEAKQAGSSFLASAAASGNAATPSLREAFLVFVVGEGRFSTPMSIVEEILPRTSEIIPWQGAVPGMVGLMPYRGDTVPVFDLATCIGVPPGADTGFVVVVRHLDGQSLHRAAYCMDSLHSVERTTRQKTDRPRSSRPGPAGAVNLLETTIRLEDGAACSVIDLAQLSRELLGLPGLSDAA